jgi:uncharacterized protein YcfL
MKTLYKILLISLLLLGCKEKSQEIIETTQKIVFNQALADELEKMAEMDQVAAYIPQGKYKYLTPEQWQSFKDSVFTTHQKRLKELFDVHGFVGFDLAGEEGSQNFWLMVQHSDHNPEFQQEVLEKMKIDVENNNAIPSNYGLLVDRVNLNTGKPQVYGTQVDYNFELAQAFSKNLADSTTVNERRTSLGMEPLEDYLNDMSKSHYMMNQEFYLEKGIEGPTLYEAQKDDFFTIRVSEKTVISVSPDSAQVEEISNKYDAEDFVTIIDDIMWYESQMLEKMDSLKITHINTDKRKIKIITPQQQLKVDNDTASSKWRYFYFDGKELLEKDVLELIKM